MHNKKQEDRFVLQNERGPTDGGRAMEPRRKESKNN